MHRNRQTYILVIVFISLLGIGPYVSVWSKPTLVSTPEIAKSKGFFDEVAEVAEKVGDIDEKAEDVKRAGEEFVDDVREEE